MSIKREDALHQQILRRDKIIKKLETEVAILKKGKEFKTLREKAKKYDTLLKKYQILMVDNANLAQMMTDMRKAVENLLKRKS
jgi:hypothetical protein